jgi:hypothetical protein
MGPDFALSVGFGAVPEVAHHREAGIAPQYSPEGNGLAVTPKKAPAALRDRGLAESRAGL